MSNILSYYNSVESEILGPLLGSSQFRILVRSNTLRPGERDRAGSRDFMARGISSLLFLKDTRTLECGCASRIRRQSIL